MATVLFASAGYAQTSTAVNLTPALLPQSFGGWKSVTGATAGTAGPLSLANTSKEALEEDTPERSQVADYSNGSRTLHVEAIQFGDRTGAYSAYTLVRRTDMREGKDVGALDAIGSGAVLFTQGVTLVLVSGAGAADVPALKSLADALPKAMGNKAVAPYLPTFAPAQGLVNGGIRYAIGPASYAAQGGVLPANSIGWEKSAEALTASYGDRRGKETLTLLVYPTPEIAGAHLRAIASALPGMGPSFANAKVRRDKELVILASGTFGARDAQNFVDSIHMRQEVSIDKDVQPVFHVEVQKTASLLVNIALLFGILAAAAILLGLFLGGGRALIRVMRGKSAAIEPEFLSLHLDPQNKPPVF